MENTDKIAVRFAHEEDIPQILGLFRRLLSTKRCWIR